MPGVGAKAVVEEVVPYDRAFQHRAEGAGRELHLGRSRRRRGHRPPTRRVHVRASLSAHEGGPGLPVGEEIDQRVAGPVVRALEVGTPVLEVDRPVDGMRAIRALTLVRGLGAGLEVLVEDLRVVPAVLRHVLGRLCRDGACDRHQGPDRQGEVTCRPSLRFPRGLTGNPRP